MIVVTVITFLVIMNRTEFRLVRNKKRKTATAITFPSILESNRKSISQSV